MGQTGYDTVFPSLQIGTYYTADKLNFFLFNHLAK